MAANELVEPPASLRARFELARTSLDIGGQRYELLRPKCIDELISEEDFAIDERIPYWADCWPSSRVLAERISRESGQGRSLLELGCGIGLVSVAAARAGFRVLATDYYADALEFTEANAARHGLEVDTRLVDWRRLPEDLGSYDVVLAADVLYEAPQAALIAAAIDCALLPGGLALVSDPGRSTAPGLLDQCGRRGLAASCLERVATEDAGARLNVSIFEIRRP